MDPSMDIFHLFQGSASLWRLVENDRPHRPHRPVQATKRVGFKMTVLCHAGGDLWMSQLHEQCPAAREEQNHFSVDLPDHRIGREKSFVSDRKCFIWHHLGELHSLLS